MDFFAIPNMERPREVAVLLKLTIFNKNGPDRVKMQWGSKTCLSNREGIPISVADDFKSATSDALKKSASLLGIALDLYEDNSAPVSAPEPTAPEEKKESWPAREFKELKEIFSREMIIPPDAMPHHVMRLFDLLEITPETPFRDAVKLGKAYRGFRDAGMGPKDAAKGALEL